MDGRTEEVYMKGEVLLVPREHKEAEVEGGGEEDAPIASLRAMRTMEQRTRM